MPNQPKQIDLDLYAACSTGLQDAVKSLCDLGADILFSDPVYQYSPLHIAAEGGFTQCVRYLLEADSARRSIDLRDEHGQTALMLASYNGHSEVVKILLAAGSDPRSKNKDNFSAENFARDEGYDEVCVLLRDQAKKLHIVENQTIENETPVVSVPKEPTASASALYNSSTVPSVRN